MSGQAGGRFLWHPAARVFDAGRPVPPDPDATGGVISPQPSGTALARAFGGPFRIGGEDPLSAGAGEFETLTSGSSGHPRILRRSMHSWIASFLCNAQNLGICTSARIAVPGSLLHSLSLYAAVEAVHLGAELHLMDSLRPDRQRAAMAGAGVTHLYATPAQCRLVVEAGGPRLDALQRLIIGGSKLDPRLRRDLAAMAPGAEVTEFYGAAEASFITISRPDTPPDSVGRAYPGVRIEIRQGARVLPEGQLGEVWTASPYAFSGYAGQGPGSARWQGEWLSVGEMGWLKDGHLYLAGRAGRMVTVADQNVFPEEIEGFMAGLPGIRRCAVLARPDALRGHVLHAVAMGDPAEEAAILRALRAHLGALKAPRHIIWRADWPVLASGKTDLAALEAGE